MPWLKQIALWRNKDIYKMSIPFTWQLPEVKKIATGLQNRGYKIIAGGPAIRLMPDYLNCGTSENDDNALTRHNPQATFTTRGCDNGCAYCGVKTISGGFRELSHFEPRPIVCDDNFLMCSDKHFSRVIEKLKPIKGVDFQGLDPKLFTARRARHIFELNIKALHFGWSSEIGRVAEIAAQYGFPKRKLTVYVLINFNDSPVEARLKVEHIKALGLRMFVMRYQPLNSLAKNSYVYPTWTEHELARFCRYWNRQNWLSKIPYEEFRG